MRVVVAATAEVAIPTLEWLRNSDHDLLRVVTTPDSRVGRGKVLQHLVGAAIVQRAQLVGVAVGVVERPRGRSSR